VSDGDVLRQSIGTPSQVATKGMLNPKSD
jgi:hypothetical protein